jgi:hypothetical protein
LQQPLAQFNHTLFNKEGLFNLINTINEHLIDGKLSVKILEKVFNLNWPDFEKRCSTIINENQDKIKPVERNSKDILKEVLITIRSLDNRMRLFDNAYATDVFIGNLHKSKNVADSSQKLKESLDRILELVPILLEKGVTKKDIIDKMQNPFTSSDLRDPIVFDSWLNKITDSYLKNNL